ncbi:hypothetical protein DJ93_2056 [Bacillus clarus]|uniref:Uncharacterized protein n=1 Tax=Bacillus clarus TaxID=2338372 RepID=A0A090YV52_9BACI|nr:hypothetical protein DJ93_2056 [Bacillus clarus]
MEKYPYGNKKVTEVPLEVIYGEKKFLLKSF